MKPETFPCITCQAPASDDSDYCIPCQIKQESCDDDDGTPWLAIRRHPVPPRATRVTRGGTGTDVAKPAGFE